MAAGIVPETGGMMASLENVLRAAPLWVIGSAFFVLLFTASLLGYRLRLWLDRGQGETQADGYLLSATLALLGLLIAFTFSLAVNRYDSRRESIIAEGNAISTAWLRASLIDGPEGEALREAIRSYVDTRLHLPDSANRQQVERESSAEEKIIWQRLRAALPGMPAPIGATVVTAITEMFDAAAIRKAERQARIPGRVLDVVSLYAVLSAGIVGYVLGRQGRRRDLTVSALLFLLLTLAMTLILDLDRPWSGAITLSSKPISDARASF